MNAPTRRPVWNEYQQPHQDLREFLSRIERAGERVDAIIDPARLREIVALHASEQLRLQVRNHAAAAGKEALAAQH